MNTIFPHQEVQEFSGKIVQREAIAEIQIESSYEPRESQAHPEELASSKPVILVTPEQYAWLGAVKSRTGKTISCIIRSLIAEQMAREGTFLVGYFDGTEMISMRSVTEDEYQEELAKADELTGGNISVLKL